MTAASDPTTPPAPPAPPAGTAGPATGSAARRRGPLLSFILSPVDGRSWRAGIAIGFGLFSTLIAASIVGTLFSMGGSLLLILVGFPIVALGIEAARLFARVERWRMSVIDDHVLIPHPYRGAVLSPSEPYGPWVRQLAEAAFFDTSRWLDVVYVLVAVPLAVIEFIVAFVLWTTSFVLLLTPLALLIPRRFVSFQIGSLELDPVLAVASTFLLGLVLLPVAASVTRGMAILHRYVVEGLLCISPTEALRRDNERLRDSRSATIELEASELRRIERDLHDGAQQRLVMLAIDLSLA
jgi:hypothetical protein